MPDALAIALQQLKKNGLPVTPATEQALRNGLAKYGVATSANVLRAVTDNLLEGIRSIANPVQVMRDGVAVTEGATRSSLTGDIHQLLADFGTPQALAESLNLNFKINTAVKVSRGAGHFLTDQTDVDEYPAWELHRLYDRKVPRGFKQTKAGLVPVPDDAWDDLDGRWVRACIAANDIQALRVFQTTKRMVALKSSGVWSALGKGAGGYTDTLGNPFAPFAFNSGYGTDGVPLKECIELGLLEKGEQPARTPFDFTSLFNIQEAAA